MRILVVEDEKRIADFLCRGLEGAGYAVDAAPNGATALDHIHNTDYDLVILDLMLPDMDGLRVLERVRNRKVGPPVLILSARGGLDDRVKGLEQGADDYLVKPFAFVELLARVRALLRRGQPTPERLQVGDLTVDCIRRKVVRGSETIDLAPKEFGILEYMMRNRGRPLSRTMIVEHVWDMDYDGLTNIVDVYIRHLRSKIDDRFQQKLIQTVRGIGYMIEAPEKPAERPWSPRPNGRCDVRLQRDYRRLTRGLRFRLTASYALFFALLLIIVATGFRQYLKTTLDNQVRDDLNDEWLAVKGGYLRISLDRPEGKYFADWYYDDTDKDETTIVGDLQKVFLIADHDGNVILDKKTGDRQVSTIYEDLGIDKPAEIRARVQEAVAAARQGTPGRAFWIPRKDSDGKRYMIRGGIQWDQNHQQPFYVALGESLSDNDKVLGKYTVMTYVGVIPTALILGSLLGWFMAGRALTPVRDVAQAAQRISGSNLSMRIPTRQAGDELDYLILTFNRMIERLEASFQQIKQFSADVSHELRTPITAIRGQLEVALFTAKTTDQYREAMFNALQDIDRLSQIVRALLLLAQAESGQLVLQKSRLNLCEVIDELVEQFQIPAEEAGVRLSADLPRDCPADVDRVQIERMINNLLSNALKFTPKGGHVRVQLTHLPDFVEIVVEDSGRGIATEYLPHIFDRFYRVPGSGTAPAPEQGLGLGLSFVAWIVKAHDGKIDVDSTPGKGTRFTIRLPAAGVGSDTMELAGQPVA